MRSGYPNVSTDMIEKLIDTPYSPLNGRNHKAVPIVFCYSWLCREETWRLDRLTDEELAQELGVPLDAIPIDKKKPIGEAYTRRSYLAKNYLLLKKGLKYQSDSALQRYREKYFDQSDGYYVFFNNFVDQYISEHPPL